jgi:hypothetical protein
VSILHLLLQRYAAGAAAVSPLSSSPLADLLDALRLPWRLPRAAVEAAGEVRAHPAYRREVLFLPEAERGPGFLDPWQAEVDERYAPELPIGHWRAQAWLADDAARNLSTVADFFAGWLGPAPIRREHNTLVCRWGVGPAAVRLIAWPPRLQRPPGPPNPAEQRDPRLRTAVHVSLATGVRLALAPRERAWAATFQPVLDLPAARPVAAAAVLQVAPSDAELSWVRDPAGFLPALHRRLGWPPGREALIFCTDQLYLVPRDRLAAVAVERLLPAKGAGGSTLTLCCRAGEAVQRLPVLSRSGPDELTATGQDIAAAFGIPCEVSPYYDDV